MKKENKLVKLGIGEAISRLMKIEFLKANRLYDVSDSLLKERELIYNALNEMTLDLNFDCDGDGVPDTVEIFEKSAKDDCCKIISSKGKPKRSKRSRGKK